MDWISYSVIVSFVAAIFVSMVYLFLYVQYPGRHFLFWFIAWVFSMFRFGFRLILLSNGDNFLLMSLVQLFSLLAIIFFLYGTFSWVGRKSPWLVVFLGVAVIAWSILAKILDLDTQYLLFPSYIFSGGVYLFTIFAVWRSHEVKGFMAGVLYAGLFLIALQKIVNPFYYGQATFIPFNYLVEASLQLVVAFGFIMAYYSRDRQILLDRQVWLDSLIEYSPIPILILDQAGRVILLNSKFSELLGYKKGEIPDLETAIKILQPDISKLAILKQILEPDNNGSNTPREGIIKLDTRSREGKTLQIESHIKKIKNHVLIYLIDITDRTLMEQELIKSGKLEVLNLLAGGIGHDFNNILASVLGNTELIRYKAKKEWDIEKNLENIGNAVQQASYLTRQLVAFTRHGKSINMPTDIRDIIKDTCEFSINGSNCKLELSMEENLYPVKGDVGNISQMLNHLVINAIDSMKQGGVLKVRAENREMKNHPILENGKYVYLSFEDQGAGIPPEEIKHIFDPFFHISGMGQGLGLATSYSIIQGMKGWIDCESTVGKGSVFSIYLPGSPQSRIVEETQSYSYQNGGGQKVLLIEDEKDIRDFVVTALNLHGFEVADFDNAEAGLEAYMEARKTRKSYALVITDLTLPGGMSGLELYRLIRETEPGQPLILTSGYNDTIQINSFQDENFSFLEKPFRIDKLFSKIQDVLGDNEYLEK